MQKLDWDDVRHFLEVVRSGSTTRAAHRLGVNQSTVSRRVTALEQKLGTGLFDRSAGTGWVITPAGEGMVEAAEQMSQQAESIQRQILADISAVRGLIRFTIGDCTLQEMVMPSIKQFVEEYPSVRLELIGSNENLNLAAREADVAIRMTDEPPSNVVGKRIATMAYKVYGIKRWLDAFEAGDGDIPCITWIGDGESLPPWIRKNFPNTTTVHRTNSGSLALSMARQGLGIVQLPCVMTDPEPNMHRIPVEFVESGWGLWVLSHVDLRTTPRVRIFRDYMVNALMDQRHLLEGRIDPYN